MLGLRRVRFWTVSGIAVHGWQTAALVLPDHIPWPDQHQREDQNPGDDEDR